MLFVDLTSRIPLANIALCVSLLTFMVVWYLGEKMSDPRKDDREKKK